MPWRRMRLRNAEVLARCDASGELVSKEGRVEVRYKPNDGRAYFASTSNLKPPGGAPKIEPDSFCGAGEVVKKPSKPKKKIGSERPRRKSPKATRSSSMRMARAAGTPARPE